MPTLRISLLGGFQLEAAGEALSPIPSRAGRLLLAYLAMHSGRPRSRELLAGKFWPDRPEAQARRRLSQALWQVQSVLAEAGLTETLLTRADSIEFNEASEYWLDTEEFERALESAGSGTGGNQRRIVEQAVALYHGDFMEGFYDDWVIEEQERLRFAHLRALEQLVAFCRRDGDLTHALLYGRRLTLQDPLTEEFHREVMRIASLLGRPNEALQQYERCRSVLADELGAEPSLETVELYNEIRARKARGAVPVTAGEAVPTTTPLVGRATERTAILAQLERAVAGSGGLLLVEGAMGIGKTRLLREAAEDARWRGMSVCWGSASPQGSAMAFGHFAGALDAALTRLRAEQLQGRVEPLLLAQAARVAPKLRQWLPDLPAARPLRGQEETQRMVESITAVFTALGQIAPHLVVLDDFHRADPDSAAALTHLVEHLDGGAIVVCVGYRLDEARDDPDVWAALGRVDAAPGRQRYSLTEFSPDQTAELARATVGAAVAEETLTQIWRETEGNPLFVLETLRAIREGTDRSPDAGLPISARAAEMVRSRLEVLEHGHRYVLNVLAVHGGPADLGTLVRACDAVKPRVLEGIEDLVQRRLVQEDDERYRIHHELVRRVAYESLRPDLRRDLHHAVAEALLHTAQQIPEVLGHHFFAAGEWASAAEWLTEAGGLAVARGGYRGAAPFYEQAVEAAGRAGLAPAGQLRILLDYERVLEVLGLRDRQQEVILAAEEIAPDRTAARAELLLRRARLAALGDEFDHALAAAGESLRLAEEGNDHTAVTRALLAEGQIHHWNGSINEAIAALERAVGLAERGGFPDLEAAAQLGLGRARLELQQYRDADACLARSRELYEKLEDPRGTAEVIGVTATASTEQGDAGRAEALHGQALELCREIGYRFGQGINLLNLAIAHYHQGNLATALAAYDEAASVLSEAGSGRALAFVRANRAALLHRMLGEDEEAERECRAALAQFRGSGARGAESHVLGILARIARRQGHPDEADALIESGLVAAREAADHHLEAQLLRNRAELALEQGHPPRAREDIEAGLRLSRELGFSDQEASFLALEGASHLDAGNEEAAVAATTAAVENLTAGVEMDQLVLFTHARSLAAAGRRTEADFFVEQAYSRLSDKLAGLDPDQRRRALQRVPEHAVILAAHGARSAVTATAMLARRDAPTGRRLTAADLTPVTWTLTLPEDELEEDPIRRRRRRLQRLVSEAHAQDASPTVGDLAAALGVSEATVRRDAAHLRSQGVALSTRGARA